MHGEGGSRRGSESERERVRGREGGGKGEGERGVEREYHLT